MFELSDPDASDVLPDPHDEFRAEWETQCAAYDDEVPLAPDAPPADSPPSEADAAALASQGKDRWCTYDAAWLVAAPLDEVPMLVPMLDIGRGRPCGIVGKDGAGKNDVVQAIALGVATGRRIWGLVDCTKGRVLHITYDLGRYAVALRYRRLAAGFGIEPHELAGQLVLSDHPKVNLCTPNAEAAFAEVMKGFSLVVVDNLRSAAPEGDENDSKFGNYMSILSAAAGKVEATVLYLHHTAKDGQGSGRGTGAIAAASGTIWNLSKEADGRTRHLQQEREHDNSDGPKPDLWLTREEIPHGPAWRTGKHAPWRVTAHLKKPATPRDEKASRRRAVVKWVREHEGCSRAALERGLGGRAELVREALEACLTAGEVEDRSSSDEQGSRLYANT